MRKFCVLLVLCLLWITPIVAQTKTDKDRDGLVGPVKSVEAYLIDFVRKDNGSGQTQFTNMEYDSHGNWTRKTRLVQSETGAQPQPYYAERRVITYY